MLLKRFANVPTRIWNNLEAEYREQLARLEAREELANDIAWRKQVPTKELIERGFLTVDFSDLLEAALDAADTNRSITDCLPIQRKITPLR